MSKNIRVTFQMTPGYYTSIASQDDGNWQGSYHPVYHPHKPVKDRTSKNHGAQKVTRRPSYAIGTAAMPSCSRSKTDDLGAAVTGTGVPKGAAH